MIKVLIAVLMTAFATHASAWTYHVEIDPFDGTEEHSAIHIVDNYHSYRDFTALFQCTTHGTFIVFDFNTHGTLSEILIKFDDQEPFAVSARELAGSTVRLIKDPEYVRRIAKGMRDSRVMYVRSAVTVKVPLTGSTAPITKTARGCGVNL
jgi:hypothetical protein